MEVNILIFCPNNKNYKTKTSFNKVLTLTGHFLLQVISTNGTKRMWEPSSSPGQEPLDSFTWDKIKQISLSTEAQHIVSTGSRSRAADQAQFSATNNTHRGKQEIHPGIVLKHYKPATQGRAEKELQNKGKHFYLGEIFTSKLHNISGGARSTNSRLSLPKLMVFCS